jgi:hypothetical protein
MGHGAIVGPIVRVLESKRFRISSIAFGNQTISIQLGSGLETHGFASSLHSEFAIIGCNRSLKDQEVEVPG